MATLNEKVCQLNAPDEFAEAFEFAISRDGVLAEAILDRVQVLASSVGGLGNRKMLRI
jgi:hypothetical protein